jgi:hypothetical protein
MMVETMLSLITRVCRLTTHLAYVSALYNLLLALNRHLHPDAPADHRLLNIAHFAL